jgi:spermidine synthase
MVGSVDVIPLADAPGANVASTLAGRSTNRRFVLVLVLFFATGASGLVYQQLWLRELSLVFGVTVHAVSTVLAAFFGGLALGGYIAGRIAGRTRRPIAWYGGIEVATGLVAIATPFLLDVAGDVYVWFADDVSSSAGALTLARFLLTFGVLMVPATFMGASLPLIVSSSLLRDGALGSRISLLYAANTAGAVVGTIVSGFWLIGLWGMYRTFLFAAAVNIVAGAVAVVAARRWDAEPATDPAPEIGQATNAVPARPPSARIPASARSAVVARRAVLAVFTISGFVTLALEVVWFRQLVLFLQSSTYAFTVMLATVLIGIATGSALAALFLRRGAATIRNLAIVEIALGFAALGSFLALSKSYGVMNRLGLEADDRSLTVIVVASAVSLLPATLLLGVAFPMGLELWIGDDVERRGQRVGTFYACNVTAGIAGSLIAGFVMVPLIGARASVVLLGLVLVATGVWLLWYAFERRTAALAGFATVAVTAVVAITLVPDPYASVMHHRFPGQTVLWKADDAQTTVSIQQAGDVRVMYLDGQHQANTTPEMVGYHRVLGALPVAIHPDPRRALVIGLGGGVSPGAMSQAPGIDVHIVELSPEVVQGARYFDVANAGVVDRVNVRITVDDGRNHLLVTDERYDVITADIIPPTHAGAGKLWSVEYWELARDALGPGGLMLQWVPQDNARDYAMVVRSFASVFPHVTAWAGGSMLIGSNEPLQLDRATLEAKLGDPAWRPVLDAAGVTSWDALAGLFTAGPDAIRTTIGDGPRLTDDQPRIEYYRTLPAEGGSWSPGVVPVSAFEDYLRGG